MNGLNSKAWMLIFGSAMIGALAIFLMVYEGAPGPLSAPHAAVISGSTIFSCKQCHTDEGLTVGCLDCHVEISAQLDTDSGYHAHLLKDQPISCEQCHAEHLGENFPLVNALSWQDQPTNTFDHPHVEFNLAGNHDRLSCEACHTKKRAAPFVLPDFPEHQRTATMLGLDQDCISCHDDIHKSGELTRDCLKCHNQEAFKPAPNFQHDTYFRLEGVHATAACSACHQTDEIPLSVNQESMLFGLVKGKACADCHETPHRFELKTDCMACHLGADATWLDGQRGIQPPDHARFGFALDGPHAKVECAKCHTPEVSYTERYPIPPRQSDQCRDCHEDPHGGQFQERHVSCLDCHHRDRFIPSALGVTRHSKTYPLKGGHQAVACIQCHLPDEQTGVRQFAATATACKDCHANPHGGQFDKQLQQNDCTVCHRTDFSTFKIDQYTHQNPAEFFIGKGHAQISCQQCHATGEQYYAASRECAACHSDTHRGQFQLSGITQCERCHSSTDKWSAEKFIHDRDAQFSLEGSHVKVACKACHQPVPQRDGQVVIQYRPLTTRCEDCHGFNTQ